MMAAACRIIARLVPLAALILWACAVLAQEPERVPPHARSAAVPVASVSPAESPDDPPLSPIEAAFSARAGVTLRLFGYDHFASPAPAAAVGTVPGGYRLGIGDTLTVTTRGPQKSGTTRHTIDGEGRLAVDGLPPMMVAGRSLDDARAELAALVAAAYPNTAVFVSLSELRRIGVVVTGSVARPGRHEMTAFATVFDALGMAGGVTRGGSLRRVRLIRAGGGPPVAVDLYGLVLGGDGGADLRLEDGDRLVVPPLGPVIGVAGPLKRPGLFEMAPGTDRLSLQEAEALAGGRLRPGPVRALRLGIGAGGAETAEEIHDPAAPVVQDGDLLLLTPRREDRQGVVRLDGHVRRPGPRARTEAPSLRRLVSGADLGDAPYLGLAALARTDPRTRERRLEPVDIQAVLARRADRTLADGDTLLVLGREEVEFLASAPVLALLRGGAYTPQPGCRGLEVLARTLAADPDGPLARGPQALAATKLVGGLLPCPPLFDAEPDLLTFALSQSVLRTGGGGRPGFYPVLSAATTAPKEDEPPAPRARVQDARSARVEVLGHVRHPGVRPLTEASTLRAALAGAGGAEVGVYPLLGVIARFDSATLTRSLLPFSPQEVTAGRADRRLAGHDRVYLFSSDTIRTLAVPKEAGKDRAPKDGDAPADGDVPLDGAVLDPDIVALIGERVVQVRGAVRLPGAYPVAGRVTAEALLSAAGGFTATADPASAELTTAATPPRRQPLDLATPAGLGSLVGAGDALRVNPIPAALEAQAVALEGEVKRPGRYDVLRGETLSSLIARAGGLTADAYPAGTVFLRESEKRRKTAEFEDSARALEAGVTRELQKGTGIRQEDVALARSLAAQLRGIDPPGRIVVEADPVELRRHPDRDPLLEAGDRITIPKRHLTVVVSGEVQAPAALRFQSGKTADDYIREAGGPTRGADVGRAFLVRPDGTAEPLFLSSWNYRVSAVAPGSAIVVPTDPKPFTGMDLFKDVGSILSQLALTAASIAVISR